jgi:hypothetical protein
MWVGPGQLADWWVRDKYPKCLTRVGYNLGYNQPKEARSAEMNKPRKC